MRDKSKGPYMTPVCQKLVMLIEHSADELTKSYLRDVKEHTRMPTYRAFDEKELYHRAYLVLSQLGKWLSLEEAKDEIKAQWKGLGRQRHEEGFALSEVIQAFSILRRNLWFKVEAEGFIDTALDFYQAMDLYNRVTQFFDRAVYYVALGYEERD